MPVIPAHNIHGRISGLHVESYEREIQSRPDVRDVFGLPYRAALQWAALDICETAKMNGHSRIAFVHESNDLTDEATGPFQFVQKTFSDMMITFAFGSKRDHVPLQCADVLAFEGNRRLRDTTAPSRKPLEVMDPTGKNIGVIDYDETDMPNFVRHMCGVYDRLMEKYEMVP